jgi:hypothetical protein
MVTLAALEISNRSQRKEAVSAVSARVELKAKAPRRAMMHKPLNEVSLLLLNISIIF